MSLSEISLHSAALSFAGSLVVVPAGVRPAHPTEGGFSQREGDSLSSASTGGLAKFRFNLF